MFKYLILLSLVHLSFGQWQFNSFDVWENTQPDEPIADVSFYYFILITIIKVSLSSINIIDCKYKP